jgi:hypothetical protein
MADTLQTQIYSFSTNKFELNVFPNPFTSEINMDFNLPSDGFVTVEILDINGAIVENLMSEKRKEGITNLSWRTSTYTPAGTYILRARVDDDVLIKKILFIK